MRNVLIVVPDATRKAHLKVVLPRLLKKIGVSSKDKGLRIKIIVATGLHKPHTRSELKKLVGERIFSKYTVMTHNHDKGNLVKIGKTKSGIPIVFNKHLLEADSIITVGLIEPHLYAGYSGGAKTIAIGLAGEETINATHHPRFLDKKGTLIDSIKNNLFQDCLWEIIKGLPIKYSINIVNDRNGKLKRVFIRELKGEIRENKGKEGRIGEFKREFNKGVRFAKKIFEKKLNKTFDAVICKVSPPKDVNMYQTSRAFNYVLNVKRPIVKRGGIVLVCASLKEGFGRGLGEKKFARALKKMKSPKEFIELVKNKGCVAGEHRAYMVAKAMTKAQLGFIGAKAAIYTKNLPFLSFPNIKSAKKFIKHTKNQNAKIYTVPHALSIIISR